jgi:hypothetical protein
MTIGTGTYSPQGRFGFPRSYIGAVAFPSELTLEAAAFGVYVLNDFGIFNDRLFVKLKFNFFQWTSNKYTLDYIVEECYFHALPSTTENPLNFHIHFLPGDGVNKATLFIQLAPFSNVPDRIALPAATVPYWRPLT